MNLFTINTKDTTTIAKTYALLQKINLIVSSIFALASLVLTIVVACDDEILWLIPLGALLVVVLAFLLIYNSLQIKFGMYYDIRMTRLITENKNGVVSANDDVLPEL